MLLLDTIFIITKGDQINDRSIKTRSWIHSSFSN